MEILRKLVPFSGTKQDRVGPSLLSRNTLVQTVKSSKGLSGQICPREVPRVIRLSQGAQPRGKVWLPERPPVGKFFRQTLRTFHCLSDFGLQKPKKKRAKVAQWACQEKQWVRTCSSLTVFNPDFGGWRTKSVYIQQLTVHAVQRNWISWLGSYLMVCPLVFVLTNLLK